MIDSNDVLRRFRLQGAGIRGGFVRLESSWAGICEHADYAPAVSRLLGQALAGSALFAGALKFEGHLSIHLRSEGPLRLLFAECTHEGRLRGLARWEGAEPAAEIALAEQQPHLAITIENTQNSARYRGLVAVEANTLAEAFEGYFGQSEQLPTRVVLAQAGGRCGGLMLQQVAGAGGAQAGHDDDAWNRVGHLLATLTEHELLELSPETLLHRLFHEEGLHLDDARPLAFACSCSYERVVGMLRALGRAETNAALQAEPVVAVTCEFCNRRYAFDSVDIAQMFATPVNPPGSATAQ